MIDKNNKRLILSRSKAIIFMEEILSNNGYYVVAHNHKDCDCKWLELWTPDIITPENSLWIGNLNLTLLGTWFTTNMLGFNRRNVLILIPDCLEVKPKTSEVYLARKFDYGFWEEEE